MSGRMEPRSTRSDFGLLLKAFRERSRLTQLELASLAGMSLAAVRDLEQGRSRRPRRESADALADALGLSPAERNRLQAVAGGGEAPPMPEPDPPAVTDPGPAAAVTLGVLGPVTLWRGGVPLPLTSAKQKAVLLRLALAAGESVGREELMDLLWGAERPASAVNLLHSYIGRIRRLTGSGPDTAPLVATGPGGYRIDADPARLDLAMFRHLAARGAEADDPETALEHFASAAALWRGETDVEALRDAPTAVALMEEYGTVLTGFAAAARELGVAERALPRLRDLAERLELHEPVHAELIVTLSCAGRQAEALDAYERIRAALADQLGVDPGERLREAHRDVLRQRLHGRPNPLRRTAVWQAPAAPVDFVGRTGELARIEAALLDPGRPGPTTRIVAVNGLAGIGKTALALRAAQTLRPEFPDGQLYADLHGVDEEPAAPLEIIARFLRGLGMSDRPAGTDLAEASACLRSALAERRMLVVLDNAKDSRQVTPLLPGDGDCAVLVTGRRRLADLDAGTVIDLDTLPVEASLDLLSALAGASRIASQDRSARDLAAACGHLPLALRIAGARLASRPAWTVGDFAHRLGDGDRRLTELSAGSGGVLGSFQLSYDGLSALARRAFRVCAIHPGDDFGLDLAAFLLDVDPADADLALGELLDTNMLLQFTTDRYRYHDLLRLFAARLLEQDGAAQDEAADRYGAWCLRGATAAIEWVYPQMVRVAAHPDREAVFPGHDDALEWLDREVPALVAFAERSADTDRAGAAWRVVDQLRGYFLLRRQIDRWLRATDAGLRAAEADGAAAGRAAMRISRGQAMWASGRLQEALDAYTLGAALAEEADWRAACAYVRHNMAFVLVEQGRLDEAERSYRLALELSADDETGHVRAVTLNGLGVMCSDQGRLTEAVGYFEAALAINAGTGREVSMLANLVNLGMVLRQVGREAEAELHLRRTLEGYRRVADLHGEMAALDELSQLHAARGAGDAAVSAGRQGLDLALVVEDRRAQAALLTTLGEARLCAGDAAGALESFGEALAIAADYPYFAVRATVGRAGALLRGGDRDLADETARKAGAEARSLRFGMLEAAAAAVRADCHAATDPRRAARYAAASAAAYRAAGSEWSARRVESSRGREPAGPPPERGG